MRVCKLVLAGILALALCTPAAAASQLQSPYGTQPLPAPSAPYPDQTQSPYGGGTGQAPQPGYPPAQTQPAQQPAYPPQGGHNQAPAPKPQPGQPSAGGGPTLHDVIGNFRLGLPQGTVAGGATYNFALPSQQVQVTIMSLASPQAFAAQQQNFASQVNQMGGRITEQRPINLAGRPADLVVAVVNNPQYSGQMMAYNVFVPSANLWLQVAGAAQAQQQIQQATSQILQALTLR